jgi:hypothetical protein
VLLALVSALSRQRALPVEIERGGHVKAIGADILVGTAPIRRFNAYVAPAGSPSRLIILFDDEIAMTLAKLARAFKGRIIRNGDIVTFVDDETAVNGGLAEQHFEGAASILLGMLFDGDGHEGVVLDVPGDFAETSSLISRLAMHFVLLHEFGHVALKHLENPTTKLLAMPDSSISEWTIGHQQELDADAHALSVFQVFSREYPAGLAGFAFALPLALFTAMDVLLLLIDAGDETNADYEALNYVTGTHPSPSVRVSHLRSLLRDPASAAFDEGFRFSVECLITVAQRASRMVRDSAHFRNLPIHPRWQAARAAMARHNARRAEPGT